LLPLLLVACSGPSSPDPGAAPAIGAWLEKPGGGYFLADEHSSGRGSRLHLLEIGWGRLVDVHDVDAAGRPSVTPVLRDVVIGEGVLSDGSTMTLETHPVTHETRLILHRPAEVEEGAGLSFADLLRQATRTLAPVQPRSDSGTSTLPASLVARDAVLVLRFDDLLEDGPEAASTLFEAVRLQLGYPPVTPALARMGFDPNHGGVVEGEFHSTRILVDLAVSEREAAEHPYALPIAPAGLPASSTLTDQPNAALHLVSRLDPFTGRMTALTNLAGRMLEPSGPSESATGDLVRAWRSGNTEDLNAGFLFDLVQPTLIGTFELEIEAAADDPRGPRGFAFQADLRLVGACQPAPRRGDLIEIGGEPY
jgi:hypothetical protein